MKVNPDPLQNTASYKIFYRTMIILTLDFMEKESVLEDKSKNELQSQGYKSIFTNIISQYIDFVKARYW